MIRAILAAAIVMARLGCLMFAVLSLGFAGKLWLHWGQTSVWTPVFEFTASFLIFCGLSVLLGIVTAGQRSATQVVPVARLSWLDRLLLVSRR